MIEVGKKYKTVTGNVWEILFQTDKSVFARVIRINIGSSATFNLGQEKLFIPSAFDNCTEYKEPVVQKFIQTIGWFPKNQETMVFFNKHLEYTHPNDVIGDVEFTLTDGRLTDVRIM